ncbi:MAG: DUF3800 domain-containing protein [bacterium]
MYIYLDESGDLGFSERASNYFVITLLFVKEVKMVKECIKKIRHKKLKKQLQKLPEIKAYNSNDRIRSMVLRCLVSKDIEVHTIVLDKTTISTKLKKENLYNYLTGMLIEECALLNRSSVTLVVDKRTSKYHVIKEFNQYVKFKVESQISLQTKFKIHHKDSETDGGLQAVDFISWSIFRNYEWKDSRFYDLIKEKITIEKKLY